MQEKVTQLLDVLKTAKNNVPKEYSDWREQEETIDLHLLEVDLWINKPDIMEKPLCEQLGVSKGVFPPVDELSDEEIVAVIDQILQLWEAYNYCADLIDDYPLRKSYEMLLSVWEEKVPLLVTGSFHFDFYSYLEEEAEPSTHLAED